MSQTKLVSLPEAALQARLSWHGLYARMLRGEIHGRRVNGHWYLPAEAVEKLAREREADAARDVVGDA